MNKAVFYVSISIAVVLSVLAITFEVPHYSRMVGFPRLLWTSLGFASVLFGILGWLWWGRFTGEDRYVAAGSTLLFGFVVIFGGLSWGSRAAAHSDCRVGTYEMVSYQSRYASGYGVTNKEEIQANQWLITIIYEKRPKSFTIQKPIEDAGVTNTITLEFCKGWLGTTYLR